MNFLVVKPPKCCGNTKRVGMIFPFQGTFAEHKAETNPDGVAQCVYCGAEMKFKDEDLVLEQIVWKGRLEDLFIHRERVIPLPDLSDDEIALTKELFAPLVPNKLYTNKELDKIKTARLEFIRRYEVQI